MGLLGLAPFAWDSLVQVKKENTACKMIRISLFLVMTDSLSPERALKRTASANIQSCGNFCLCHICQSQFSRAKRTQKDTGVFCVAVITLNWFFLTGEKKPSYIRNLLDVRLENSKVVVELEINKVYKCVNDDPQMIRLERKPLWTHSPLMHQFMWWVKGLKKPIKCSLTGF